MCLKGDKLADSCLKQTTLSDDIVSLGLLIIVLLRFQDNIMIWLALFTNFLSIWVLATRKGKAQRPQRRSIELFTKATLLGLLIKVSTTIY